ncbi:MAG: collagen-like protein [Flavobacterium sp.]
MKKLVLLFSAIGMIALQSCEGPAGPPGPPGNPGVNIEAQVYEVTRSFNQGNGFSQLITFNTPMFASDVVLVYILWDVDGNTPIWRLMPQTVQWDEGDFIYNFDFTRFDVRLFMTSADFPLNILGPQWTNNQTFRIVLVPGYFGNNLRVNYNDYEAVMNMIGKTEADVRPIESRQ